MLLLSRRQTRAAMSAAAGAAVYLAASELGKDKLKMTGLFILASASMAGMVTTKASAKAYSAHKRLDLIAPLAANAYQKSGGTISGSVTVTGDHHIQGSLFGSGGTLDIGDTLDTGGGALQVNPQLTILSASGVHTNGGFFGHTTGDSQISATTPTGAWYTQVENRVNDILTAIG